MIMPKKLQVLTHLAEITHLFLKKVEEAKIRIKKLMESIKRNL